MKTQLYLKRCPSHLYNQRVTGFVLWCRSLVTGGSTEAGSVPANTEQRRSRAEHPGWLWEHRPHLKPLSEHKSCQQRSILRVETQQCTFWGWLGQMGRMRGTNLSWKARERAGLSTASLSWGQLQIQPRATVLQKTPGTASQTLGFVRVAIKPILLTNFDCFSNK